MKPKSGTYPIPSPTLASYDVTATRRGRMDRERSHLEAAALRHGVEWAERMWTRLVIWGRKVPLEWPGTRAYARALVLGFARSADPELRERLVLVLQRAAE